MSNTPIYTWSLAAAETPSWCPSTGCPKETCMCEDCVEPPKAPPTLPCMPAAAPVPVPKPAVELCPAEYYEGVPCEDPTCGFTKHRLRRGR